MKIEILTTDGSPLGVTSKTVWGDSLRIGVGGAELALITMCEEWTKRGDEVILYNDPSEPGVSPFEQRARSAFNPNDERDVLITFRTPNPRAIPAKGLKVWWSTDQYTSVPFNDFSGFMDKTVVISPFHAEYFAKTYNISEVTTIDLPVRVDDYSLKTPPLRIPNRVIFTSIPDRGLDNLWRQWGHVVKNVPDASLVITSDYRLWGAGANNERYKARWLVHDNVKFVGAIPRAKLIEEQLKAEVHLYPCRYEELFCIAVAESQYAGAYPVTSGIGALKTTNMGKVFDVDPNDPRNDIHFTEYVIELLSDKEKLHNMARDLHIKASKRFAPKTILKQWDKKVFK